MSNAALCISGMGRSGTSLTTSWLEKCGLSVHDGQVLGANAGNTHGHFEDQEFLDFHAQVITRHAPRSQGWKVDGADFLSFTPDERKRARTLAARRAARRVAWGWKDPRSLWFLPEWKAIVPDLKVLLLWRPCVQVVRSLLKRSKEAHHHPHLHVTVPQAVALWRAANERVCGYKQLYPADTVLLPLSVVVQHDRRAWEHLNARLELGLNYRPLCQVYDPALLHGQPSSRLRRALAWVRGGFDLEKRLAELSDLTLEVGDAGGPR